MVQVPNIFALGMGAYDDQTQRLRDATQYSAQRQAGANIGAGDYAGAANVLGNAGDLGGQQRVTTAGNAFGALNTAKEAGASIAGGDFQGGSDILNRGGQLDAAHNVIADKQTLDDRKAAAAQKIAAQKLDAFTKLADMASTLPQGSRLAWMQQHAQDLVTLGVPAQQLSQMTEDSLSDANLATFKAGIEKQKLQFLDMGPDKVGVDAQGNVKKVFRGNVAVKKDETILAPDDSGYAGAITGGPAAAPGPVATAPQTVAPANAPRSVRNNNPLNLTTLPQGQWDGQTGADGRFATFSSPEAGFAAADQNLQNYATHHGITTVAGIVNRWAPKGDGANDPAAYAATVSKDIGVQPDQALNLADPKVRSAVLHSMAKVEGGGASGGGADTLQGGAGQDTIAPKGYHVLANGPHDPEDEPMSPEAKTMAATQMAMTGKLPAFGMGKAARNDRKDAMDEAAQLIKKWGISPEDWVTGVAQFKVAQGSLTKISQTKNMVQASENAVVANMNRVVLPLMTKVQPGGIPFLNKYVMAVRDHAFGDPDVKAYDNALHTVADEYAKVMTTTSGAGGSPSSDSARNEAYRRLSTAQTGPQLQETFKTLQAEMANRRAALEQQESALTGQLRHGLAPGGAPGADPAAAAAPIAAPPAPAASGWGQAQVVRH